VKIEITNPTDQSDAGITTSKWGGMRGEIYSVERGEGKDYKRQQPKKGAKKVVDLETAPI